MSAQPCDGLHQALLSRIRRELRSGSRIETEQVHCVAFEIELDDHDRFIAFDPGIVARIHGDHRRRYVVETRSVGVFSDEVTASKKTNVTMLAPVRANEWLHMRRPSPTRCIDQTMHPTLPHAASVNLHASEIVWLGAGNRAHHRIIGHRRTLAQRSSAAGLKTAGQFDTDLGSSRRAPSGLHCCIDGSAGPPCGSDHMDCRHKKSPPVHRSRSVVMRSSKPASWPLRTRNRQSSTFATRRSVRRTRPNYLTMTGDCLRTARAPRDRIMQQCPP